MKTETKIDVDVVVFFRIVKAKQQKCILVFPRVGSILKDTKIFSELVMKKSTYDDVDDDDDGDDKREIRQNRAKTSSIDSDEDFFLFFFFFGGAKKINVTKLYLFGGAEVRKV